MDVFLMWWSIEMATALCYPVKCYVLIQQELTSQVEEKPAETEDPTPEVSNEVER